MLITNENLKTVGSAIIICTESELQNNINIINTYMTKQAGRNTEVYITSITPVVSKYTGTINNSAIDLSISNNYILLLDITATIYE